METSGLRLWRLHRRPFGHTSQVNLSSPSASRRHCEQQPSEKLAPVPVGEPPREANTPPRPTASSILAQEDGKAFPRGFRGGHSLRGSWCASVSSGTDCASRDLFHGQYPFVYDNTVVAAKTTENSSIGQCVITLYTQWGPLPVPVLCPYCKRQIVTKTVYSSGFLTWMLCGALATLGCFLGCCLMPFCIRGCKDISHVCPECSRVLGTFRRV
ncbi:cell death-inducing p53-target protein 1-like isoform X4 [Dermacentor albipictus]|uniref:cell death-inducing p53-target protein 1-like isoform X4 n=1 Tax=Dermacentor albipictus TaxID=60249 RepID=UPI0038FD1C86